MNRCKELNDERIENFSQGFKRLGLLRKVSINLRGSVRYEEIVHNFRRCDQITEEGVDLLIMNIKRLGSLQSLKLNFNWYVELQRNFFSS